MEKVSVPSHIAIIMDGNGRWAQNKGLKRTKGHEKGTKVLKEISEYVYDKNVKVLSVFAFSTENWKRDKEEVDYLMNLFLTAFKQNFEQLKNKGVRVIFSGLKDKLSNKVLNAMDKMVNDTKNNTKGIFNICINYGGQDELVEATKKVNNDIISGKLKVEDLNKEILYKYMFNDLPPIDLMIRTSGEYRISNFMLYQLAYAELYFTDVLWPDFNKNELLLAIKDFQSRKRRFGAIKE